MPWTTGPRSRAGKKVSAPISTTTPISRPAKVGVSVRIVPRPAGATRLLTITPATASVKTIGMKRASIIVMPPSRSANVMPWAPMFPGSGWK